MSTEAGSGTADATLKKAETGPFTQSTLLEALAHLTNADARRLDRNEILYRQGDEAEDMFVVQSGRIAISNCSGEGRESLVGIMERGATFGMLGLFDEGPRSVQARALEASTVLALPYARVRKVLDDRPQLLWGLTKLVAARLRAVDEALADNVFLDVPGRTAKRLLELAGDDDDFVLPVTQEELAAMVGASRERVNKALSTFARLGWIEQHERRYKICDRTQLVRRAEI